MINPKPSGPLWAYTDRGGRLNYSTTGVTGTFDNDDHPCRLLPGHGQWVPLDLVRTVESLMKELSMNAAFGETPKPSDFAAVNIAIRAALEGAV